MVSFRLVRFQTNELSDQWAAELFNCWISELSGKSFRTNELLDQWAFGQRSCWISELSDKWAIGSVRFRTNELLDQWTFGQELSDKWAVGSVNFRTNELLDKWAFGQIPQMTINTNNLTLNHFCVQNMMSRLFSWHSHSEV